MFISQCDEGPGPECLGSTRYGSWGRSVASPQAHLPFVSNRIREQVADSFGKIEGWVSLRRYSPRYGECVILWANFTIIISRSFLPRFCFLLVEFNRNNYVRCLKLFLLLIYLIKVRFFDVVFEPFLRLRCYSFDLWRLKFVWWKLMFLNFESNLFWNFMER